MLNEHADMQLRYRTYQWGTGLQFLEQSTIEGATGGKGDVTWSGDDLVVGWSDDGTGAMRETTTRAAPPTCALPARPAVG